MALLLSMRSLRVLFEFAVAIIFINICAFVRCQFLGNAFYYLAGQLCNTLVLAKAFILTVQQHTFLKTKCLGLATKLLNTWAL